MADTITVDGVDLSSYFKDAKPSEAVNFGGDHWSAHVLGDCDVCGAAMNVYRFTPKQGDQWHALMCSQDMAHSVDQDTRNVGG